MGVPGLWDIVAPAGVSRSLTHLTVVNGYEGNPTGKRAYRIGIDASIWYKHASFSKGGENPELRLLFFRLRDLAALPILPLFVFDGRERPKVKRGSRMGKSGSHRMTQKFKELLDTFGMEWRMALGEAEAELAFLNRTGVVDAIMTDDVDALIFGATTVVRNVGGSLTGNKSNPALRKDGKKGKDHTMLFTADAVRNNPAIQLSRGGMVLFALLVGGDYDKGVDKMGKMMAHALARCGFGDELLQAFERREYESLHLFFPGWRVQMNQELRTNSRGYMNRAYPNITIPDHFPNIQYLEYYATPRCSASLGQAGGGPVRGNKEMNLAKIASFCEENFEWGTRSEILKRFASLLWKASVIRVLRRAALEQDTKEVDDRIRNGITDRNIRGATRPDRDEAIGTPAPLIKKYLSMSVEDSRAAAFSNRRGSTTASQPYSTIDSCPLLTKIHSERKHVSTDETLEYRVEVNPRQLVELTLTGIRGLRQDGVTAVPIDEDAMDVDTDPEENTQSTSKKKAANNDPYASLRMWVPASMMWRVHTGLVEDFELGKEKRRLPGRRKGRARNSDNDVDESEASASDEDPTVPVASTSAKKGAPKTSKAKEKTKTAKRKSTVAGGVSTGTRPHQTQVTPLQTSGYLPTPPSTQLPREPSDSSRNARPNLPQSSRIANAPTTGVSSGADGAGRTDLRSSLHTLSRTNASEASFDQYDSKYCQLNGSKNGSIFLFTFPDPDNPDLIKVPAFEAPSFECRWASLNDSDSDDYLDGEDEFTRMLNQTSFGNKGKARAGTSAMSASAQRVPAISGPTTPTGPSQRKRQRTQTPGSASSLELIDSDNEIEMYSRSRRPLFMPPMSSSPPPSSSPPREPLHPPSARNLVSGVSAPVTTHNTSRIFEDVDKVVDLTVNRSRRGFMY